MCYMMMRSSRRWNLLPSRMEAIIRPLSHYTSTSTIAFHTTFWCILRLTLATLQAWYYVQKKMVLWRMPEEQATSLSFISLYILQFATSLWDETAEQLIAETYHQKEFPSHYSVQKIKQFIYSIPTWGGDWPDTRLWTLTLVYIGIRRPQIGS